jgi:glycosyltransferase involved in cell wall biosynthesis
LEQQFDDARFEVIVVNDSGQKFLKEPWHQDERVRVISTNNREKSIARNTGAAIAKGRYLHFLDDDDWLLPGAFQSFWKLSRKVQAALYYGGSSLTNRKGEHLLDLHPELVGNAFIQLMAGEWIPLGAYIMEADTFFAIGGFNPLMTIGEDSDLCRRIALIGDIAGTPTLILCAALGSVGSTADYTQLPIQSRWARELILNERKSLDRMRKSTSNSYWNGRIVRAYLTSVVWNIQNKKLFTAASRFTRGLASLVLAGTHVFSIKFWHAVGKPHQSTSFAKDFHGAANNKQGPVKSRANNSESTRSE